MTTTDYQTLKNELDEVKEELDELKDEMRRGFDKVDTALQELGQRTFQLASNLGAKSTAGSVVGGGSVVALIELVKAFL